MKTSVYSWIYTNMILTVIAVLLLTLSLHEWKVGVVSSADAQSPTMGTGSNLRSDSYHPPVNGTNIPQVQDAGLAAATLEVANANRDIAAALRELGKSIETAGTGMVTALKANSGSSAAARPAGTTAAAPEQPVVQVGPNQ
jgi:hypothetical protein